MSERQRKAIVVVGMHRSGTSALARILELLGWKNGAKLIAANSSNPTGHWEIESAIRINDKLLAAAGSHWAEPKPIDLAAVDEAIMLSCQSQIQSLIETEFDDVSDIIIKDPRISRLLPVWIEALEKKDFEPYIVLACRSPVEVADSLQARNFYNSDHSLLLWQSYVHEAEIASRGFPRVVIDYGDMLESWRTVLDDAFARLGVSPPRKVADATEAISAFLDPGLRHNNSSKGDTQSPTEPHHLAMCSYKAILRWKNSEAARAISVAEQKWRNYWRQQALGAAPSVQADQLIDFHISQVIYHETQNNIDLAIAQAERAMQIAPRNAHIHHMSAGVFERAGQLDKAIAAERVAVVLNDELAHYWRNLSNLLAKCEFVDDAVECATRALQLEPEQFRHHLHLAQLLLRSGAVGAALEVAEKAVRLSDSGGGPQFLLSRVLARIGRRQEAINAARSAIRIEPDSEAYQGHLTQLLDQTG